MASITILPEEILTIILSYNDITIEDIINFRCVCKLFQNTAKYSQFLEKKLYQRWPNAMIAYQNCEMRKAIKSSEQKTSTEKKDKQFIKFGISGAIIIKEYLSQITFYHYYDNVGNPNYTSVDKLVKFNEEKLDNCLNLVSRDIATREYGMNYMFFFDETKILFTRSRRGTDRNLIERYCDIKMSHYTKIASVKNELDKLLKKPEREQLLEKTCTFLAQLMNPKRDISYSNVEKSLDSFAQEILNYFKKKHPNHSIFTTSEEIFLSWKNNNIDDNYWNETESEQIINTLNEYFFGKLKFRLRKFNDYENLCLDHVLESKHGDDIIISTIYHSVARRLGLCCNITKIHWNVCIFWKVKYTPNDVKTPCLYITPDVYTKLYVKPSEYSFENSNSSKIQGTIIKSKEMIFEIRQSIRTWLDNHILNHSKLIVEK